MLCCASLPHPILKEPRRAEIHADDTPDWIGNANLENWPATISWTLPIIHSLPCLPLPGSCLCNSSQIPRSSVSISPSVFAPITASTTNSVSAQQPSKDLSTVTPMHSRFLTSILSGNRSPDIQSQLLCPRRWLRESASKAHKKRYSPRRGAIAADCIHTFQGMPSGRLDIFINLSRPRQVLRSSRRSRRPFRVLECRINLQLFQKHNRNPNVMSHLLPDPPPLTHTSLSKHSMSPIQPWWGVPSILLGIHELKIKEPKKNGIRLVWISKMIRMTPCETDQTWPEWVSLMFTSVLTRRPTH